MRGVVTLAVALALPEQMPGRDLMLVAAFAVILVTVILQGSSLGRLIALLRPVDEDPPAKIDLAGAEAAMARAKAAAMEVQAYGPDGELLHPQLLEQYRNRARYVERYAGDAESFTPGLRAHFDAVLAAIAAGRAELVRLHRQGLIEDEILHDLERDLDLEELGALYQRGE
jgi:CPA1 family monovalent cation:H+ antiporter